MLTQIAQLALDPTDRRIQPHRFSNHQPVRGHYIERLRPRLQAVKLALDPYDLCMNVRRCRRTHLRTGQVELPQMGFVRRDQIGNVLKFHHATPIRAATFGSILIGSLSVSLHRMVSTGADSGVSIPVRSSLLVPHFARLFPAFSLHLFEALQQRRYYRRRAMLGLLDS